jgi:hypothetical protein
VWKHRLVAVTIGLLGALAQPSEHASARHNYPPPEIGPAPLSDNDRFVARTRREGRRTVLPINFADGQRVELVYPPNLDLAGLGFTSVASVQWDRRSVPGNCCSPSLLILHTTAQQRFGNVQPLATYPGFDGQLVRLLPGESLGTPAVRYLVYEFGPWLVEFADEPPGLFGDEMADLERATWARSLEGTVDRRGFLRLKARPPLRGLRVRDSALGIAIAGQPGIEFIARRCGPSGRPRGSFVQSNGERGVSWCDGRTGIQVSAYGPDDFVERVRQHLRVRGP